MTMMTHCFRALVHSPSTPPSLANNTTAGPSSNAMESTETEEEEEGNKEEEDEEEDYKSLPEGIPKGWYVVKQYALPTDLSQSDLDHIAGLSPSDIARLDLQAQNLTVPVALMMLDPAEYPSLSKARKACRKATILIHRGPLLPNNDDNNDDKNTTCDTEGNETPIFDTSRCQIGRVGDRVHPGDVLARQVRMGSGYFAHMNYKQPNFDLPVVYQDDHFALVQKPAGIVVYSHPKAGYGTMTIRAALPFALKPPRAGTYSVMRRPASVHRLDKPTSGLLVVAKTKPALWDLSKQFHDRIVKKTYHAIVNGIPPEPIENVITAQEAFDLGVDADPNQEQNWNLIDYSLDGRSAITVWRAVEYVPSLHAHDGYLTLVELKPKTGRYHQLRRHMAMVCERPLVGDDTYDGGTPSALKFRERGLFLCSTRVTLEHPFYNSPNGRVTWEKLEKEQRMDPTGILSYCHEKDKVVVEAEIDLPSKFYSLLDHERERHTKFSSSSSPAKDKLVE